MDIEQIPHLFILAVIAVWIFAAGFILGVESGRNEGANTAYRSLLEQNHILVPAQIDSSKETENDKR